MIASLHEIFSMFSSLGSAQDRDAVLSGIDIWDIDGISEKTKERMKKLQIDTLYDLRYSQEQFIKMNFTQEAQTLYTQLIQLAHEVGTEPLWYKQVISADGIDTRSEIQSKASSSKIQKESPSTSKPLFVFDTPNLFNYQQLPTISF